MEKLKRKKHTALKIAGVILVLLAIAVFFVYKNFNRLVSDALIKSFNSNIVSDVYELKFEKLSVDFLSRDIKVHNVVFQPLQKPLNNYPYINSSVQLKTKKIALENVSILTLLNSGILKLEKIEIEQPEIELIINDKLPIFFPFSDTAHTVNQAQKKKSITGFLLKDFKLLNATIHTTNSARQREFNVQKLSISLNDLLIDQQPGKDLYGLNKMHVSIESADGIMQKAVLKKVSLKNFSLQIDSIQIEKTLDTLINHFDDFTSGFSDLDIQTADSVFHIVIGKFLLSYKQKSVQLSHVVYKPNIGHDAMQHKFEFQHTEFEVSADSLAISNMQFDSLLYKRKLFIDEIWADGVTTAIYKDKTKPLDKNRFPTYFGQQIMTIPIPVMISLVKVTHANLTNTERKPDSSYANVHVNRGTVSIKNITNLSPNSKLEMIADAYIENKAHAFLSLGFYYDKPQFSIAGNVKAFKLPDINPLLQSYTPAKITNGTSDEISFTGMIFKTNATGTMKFLYHNLVVDLALKNQAKWKSSVLAFAANTGLNSANPVSSDQPPRIVKFNAERDMNKGFFNIIIRSILTGFKETMFMSKENRKAHQKSKKEFKEKNKK